MNPRSFHAVPERSSSTDKIVTMVP